MLQTTTHLPHPSPPSTTLAGCLAGWVGGNHNHESGSATPEFQGTVRLCSMFSIGHCISLLGKLVRILIMTRTDLVFIDRR